MKMYRFLKITLIMGLLSSPAMAMEISRNNYVDMVLASAVGKPSSNFVQWKNPINSACKINRTKFSIDDKGMMSLLLAAILSGKKMGVYYDLTSTTPGVPGHGV